jgi:hypothetical protein
MYKISNLSDLFCNFDNLEQIVRVTLVKGYQWLSFFATQRANIYLNFYKFETKSFTIHLRGYSSVVEHSTADREVPGSNPGAP